MNKKSKKILFKEFIKRREKKKEKLNKVIKNGEKIQKEFINNEFYLIEIK